MAFGKKNKVEPQSRIGIKGGVKKSTKTDGPVLTDVNFLASKDISKSLFNKIVNSGAVNKDFIHFNEEDPPPKEFIKTNITALDNALGGGIPVGKMGEIFGQNATGKSTLSYHLAKAFQDAGGYVLSVDTEHSWDQDRFEAIGGDRTRIILSEVDTAEQLFMLVSNALGAQVEAGEDATPLLILIDTVAAAPLAAEMAAIMAGRDYEDMGRKAKFLSIQLRQLPRLVGASKTSLVFINQVRMKMNTMAFQDPYLSTGGEAIKFYSSWRLKLSNLGKIKDGEEVVGQKVRIETVKCKTSSPFQKVELDLVYKTGKYDQLAAIVAELKKRKWLKKSKSGWKLSEELIGLGMDAQYPPESEEKFKAAMELLLPEITKLVSGDTDNEASSETVDEVMNESDS